MYGLWTLGRPKNNVPRQHAFGTDGPHLQQEFLPPLAVFERRVFSLFCDKEVPTILRLGVAATQQ